MPCTNAKPRRITAALRRALAGLALGLAATAPLRAETGPVHLFAAASLTTALAEIEPGFEAATGHDLVVSLGGSSALARQIQQGAPADVFISASADWVDVIEAEGLIAAGGRFDLLGNALVLITHGRDAAPVEIGPGLDLLSLLGEGRLAMALVDAVPAGIYGKAALTHLGHPAWLSLPPRDLIDHAGADPLRRCEGVLDFIAPSEVVLGEVEIERRHVSS